MNDSVALGLPSYTKRISSKRLLMRRWFLLICVPVGIIMMASLSPGAFAQTIKDQTGRSVRMPTNPQRLVSLAPNITEMIYAFGLADKLVADTDQCDFPPEARSKPHVGTMLNPSLEKIVGLRADLVLGAPSANRRETADQLEKLGIPLYGVAASTLMGTMESMENLGQVLNRGPEAKKLVLGLKVRISRVEKAAAGKPRPRVLFVVWYRPLITVGPSTFIADIIRTAGGVSVGDDLKGEWPRLNLEELLRRDPDVILLPKTESFSPGLEEFRTLPGWKSLRAVKEGRMYFVSETIMRSGPRIVDALEEVAGVLHPSVATPTGAKR